MSGQLNTWFQFATQQVAAEAYLDGIDWARLDLVAQRLERGNVRLPHDPEVEISYSRMPRALGDAFAQRYTILAHRANDATGFSATLLRWTNEQNETEYTVSIRSTEFKPFAKGGDRERDNFSGANGEIIGSGFAIGQLVAMEDFYRREVLPIIGSSKINVTGYSLGGHLATVFTETHADRVKAAYVFNGAGRGRFVVGATTAERMAAMIAQFGATLVNEPNADVLNGLSSEARARFLPLYRSALQAHLADPGWNPFAPTDASIYADPRYRWARAVTGTLGSYQTGPGLPFRSGLGTAGDALITSIYGSALNNDSTLVANSQIHASNKNAVLIEGQPLVEGVPVQERSDFGNTHAITLIVDSLALQREFLRLDPRLADDPSLARELIETAIKASSAQRTAPFAPLGDPRAAEGDSLEKALLYLRRAFDPAAQEISSDRTPGGFGNIENRQRFYEELAKLPQQGSYRIEVLAGKTPAQIVTLAKGTGLAVRYALRQIEPFAVVGGDYSMARFPNGELERFNATTGRGLTDAWIDARAKFLETVARYNTANGDLTVAQIGSFFEDRRLDIKLGSPIGERPQYVFGADGVDRPLIGFSSGDFLFGGGSGETITANAGNDIVEGGGGIDIVRLGDGHDVARGGEGGDELYGEIGADRLFGDAGDDRLEGGKGNDRLEGGGGFDTYVWSAGDGHDTILDSDGSGQISYKGRVLSGGAQMDSRVYTDALGTRYELIAGAGGRQTLVIDGAISVENFTSGNLGIVLQGDSIDPPAPPQITPTRVYELAETFGSVVPYPSDRPAEGTSDVDHLRHYYVNMYGSGASDSFTYTDHPFGFPGFYGRGGDDEVIVSGAVGNATVDGGAGEDFLDASSASYAGGGPLTLAGGAGDDFILGSAARETIWGDNYRTQNWFHLAPGFSGPPGAYLIDSFVFNLRDAFGILGDSAASLAQSGAYYYRFGPQPAYAGFASPESVVRNGGVESLVQYVQLEGWQFPGGLASALDYVLGADPTFDDFIDAAAGNDSVNGGSGADEIYGGPGNDVIDGDRTATGAGFGALAARFGAPGDDSIDGGDGDDRISDFAGGNDTLIGGAGNDHIGSDERVWAQVAGQNAYNYIDGGEGDDRITAINGTPEGFDVVICGAGSDAVYAASLGGGVLLGGDGDDTLEATIGVSVIGGGFWEVDGGAGNDTFSVPHGVVRDSEGDDTLLTPFETPQATEDRFIVFALPGFELPPEFVLSKWDQRVYRDGVDLVVSRSYEHEGQTTVLATTIADWYLGSAPPIEHIEFVVGVQASPSDLAAWGSYQIGSPAADDIGGAEHSDRILGQGGDDTISTGAGDDLIAGGAGDDVLDGGTGDDKYYFAPGDGNDMIVDTAGSDALYFDQRIDASSVSVELAASQAFLKVAGSTLTIARSESGAVEDFSIDRLVFANGATLAFASLVDTALVAKGTPGSDALTGNGAANVIQGGPGADSLAGGAGDDTYVFSLGDGIDRISDVAGAGEQNTIRFGAGISPDMLTLGAGSLVIRVGSGGDEIHLEGVDPNDIFGVHDIDLFAFEDGTQLTYNELIARGLDHFGTESDDFIAGSNTSDRVYGYGGNDLLVDGAGDDSYFFGRGDGADTIVEGDAHSTDIDTLVLGAGISPADLSARRSMNDIVLQMPGTGDSVTIGGAFLYDVVERVSFSEGTVWSGSDLRDRASPPSNHAPVTVGDAASVVEDGSPVAAGNVLANDVDADADVLSVADPGVYAGTHGSLDLASNGDYLYTLDNASTAVQTLRAGQIVQDTFAYQASDGVESADGSLVVSVAGVNDAPAVANPISDQAAAEDVPFAFAVPLDTFSDPDAGDTRVLRADLASGDPLPAWLEFAPASGSFSGTPANGDVGVMHVRVTALDGVGAQASGEFALTVANVNDAPLAGAALAAQSVQAGAMLSFALPTDAGGTAKGGAGDDVIAGSTGNETLIGRGGNDYLTGFEGDDILRGGSGNDVLQGGTGNDVLRAGSGHNLLDGGSGDDLIFGGRNGGLLVGGTGNDVIRTGRGRDIIAFNRGDGRDTVYSDREGNNTLSLGGGITYADLRFRKSGKDLVLEIGDSDSITFKHWYGGQGRTSLLNIQIVTEATAGFDDTASDPMQGARVNNFNAAGLVDAFDQARAAQPGLSSWALTNALAQFHLSGSDDAALGGDLAYHYGLRGSLAGMSLAAAQEAIGAPGFGSDAQQLRPFTGLSEGFVKLS